MSATLTAVDILGRGHATQGSASAGIWHAARHVADIMESDRVFAGLLATSLDRAIVIEYARFMVLKVVHNDIDGATRTLSPSAAVDAVWHTHMLMPQDYLHMCRVLLGSAQHCFWHNPATADDADRAARYNRTREQYTSLFQAHPSDTHWPNEPATGRAAARPVGGFGMYVRGLRGETMAFTGVTADTTIETLKHAISGRADVPIDRQRLIFGGQQLDSEKTFGFYQIRDASTVHLVLRITGC